MKDRSPMGWLYTPQISSSIADRKKLFSGYPHVLGLSYPTELKGKMYDPTKSGKFNVSASKPEAPIYLSL